VSESSARPPNAFISYSWTSSEHAALVREWSDRLRSDGVDVVLDQYDLKEGDDKYAYMERMVTDVAVTHVLVICDAKYAERADGRARGVGVESQIMTRELYAKVEQSKFIPIFCEFGAEGEPVAPVFLRNRIGFDFSTPGRTNQNWESLVRRLYDKPLHRKPALGTPPTYLDDETALASPTGGKLSVLTEAMRAGRSIRLHQREFFNAVFEEVDALRLTAPPPRDIMSGEAILGTCDRLRSSRNYLIDWLKVVAEVEDAAPLVRTMLERVLMTTGRPAEFRSAFNESWFVAHDLFAYEVFLYCIAALVDARKFAAVHALLTTHYVAPSHKQLGTTGFARFTAFYSHSDEIGNAMKTARGSTYTSPVGEMLKRHADRDDLSFASLMEADALVLLAALIEGLHWYPHTLAYAVHAERFPLFHKAARKQDFDESLAVISGVTEPDELRRRIAEALANSRFGSWAGHSVAATVSRAMNIDALGTLA
jgi:hypothetical protein